MTFLSCQLRVAVADDAIPFVCRLMPFVINIGRAILPLVSFHVPSVAFGPSAAKNTSSSGRCALEKPRLSAGFTLIELVVTLAVVAILVAAGAPSFRAFVVNNRIATQANDFMGDLMYARSEAAKRGMPVFLCKSTNADTASPACTTEGDWESGWAIYVDTDGTPGLSAATEVLRTQSQLAGGNSLRASGEDWADSFAFRPTGTLDPSPDAGEQVLFTLCDDRGAAQARAVEIELTGRASVLRYGSGELTCP